jgi:hypothetical protein
MSVRFPWEPRCQTYPNTGERHVDSQIHDRTVAIRQGEAINARAQRDVSVVFREASRRADIFGSAQDCSFSNWCLIKSAACSASLRTSGLNLMAVPLFGTITRSDHISR